MDYAVGYGLQDEYGKREYFESEAHALQADDDSQLGRELVRVHPGPCGGKRPRAREGRDFLLPT